MKKSFEAPTLEALGTIAELTGTGGGNGDWCLDLGGDKGLGYPSDQTWKFIPVCDTNGDNDENSIVS